MSKSTSIQPYEYIIFYFFSRALEINLLQELEAEGRKNGINNL
jgi:hypothetical protein